MKNQIFFSIKTLIINDNKFLALYNYIDGIKQWDLPGGRMEFGETAEETLKREIREELNVEIEPVKVIDTWNYMHNESSQITGIIYYSEISSGTIKISDEHDGYAWVGFEEIRDIFTKEFLLEQMEALNWQSIMNNDIKFTEKVIV